MRTAPLAGTTAAALLPLLLACGGGGGSGPAVTPATPATPPVPAGSPPQLTGFSPKAGFAGQVVTLQGSHFTGATQVLLGGKSTLFKLVDDGSILATPPSDGSTGPVTVVTPAGSATSADSYVFQPVTGDLVLSGGFEDAGGGNWLSTANQPPFREVSANAHGGAWYAILLGNGTGSTEELTQDLTLPAAGKPILTYWTRISANTGSSPSDQLLVEVRDLSGAVLQTLATHTPAEAGTVWVQHSADLSAHLGTSIRLAFKAKEITAQGTSFRVDDISLPMPLPGARAVAFNASLAGAYLVQSTQTPARSVPLVSGRDAWLRVFAEANQPNIAQPPVEAVFRNNGAVLGTLRIPAPAGGLPTAMNEGIATFSYMARVPAAWIRPGLSVAVTLDPAGSLLEYTTSDNQLTFNADVRTVPDFPITLFSVRSASGSGNVTSANLDAWLDRLRRLYPLQTLDARFGGTFVTSQDLEAGASADTGTGPWAACVAELEAKRQADPGGTGRTYFGGVKVTYSGGIAGIANSIPVPGSRTGWSCLGWDNTGRSDGGNFPEVLAHEVGHTLGRRHSPCGSASGTDAEYPYPLADIGVYGLDADTGTLKTPHGQTDIMGYCSPVWISDYVFKKVLDFRNAIPAAASTAATEPCLLVMGVMTRGELDLKPAFTLEARPALPEAGPYVLEALDAGGKVLLSRPFALHDLEDGAPEAGAGTFTFTVPLEAARAAQVATLRVRRDGDVLVSRTRTPASRRDAALGVSLREPVATRLSGGRVFLSWDASSHPLVMMRDPASGTVLGFVRQGDTGVEASGGGEVELLLSDGITSTRVRTPVLGAESYR